MVLDLSLPGFVASRVRLKHLVEHRVRPLILALLLKTKCNVVQGCTLEVPGNVALPLLLCLGTIEVIVLAEIYSAECLHVYVDSLSVLFLLA